MGCNRANARQQRTVSSGRQGLGSVRGPCVVQVKGWHPGRACSEDILDYLGAQIKAVNYTEGAFGKPPWLSCRICGRIAEGVCYSSEHRNAGLIGGRSQLIQVQRMEKLPQGMLL